MRRLATFERKLAQPLAEVTSECEAGNVLSDLQLKLGGYYNADSTSNCATDGPFHWLGRLNVKAGARSIVDMPGPDLRHLTAVLAGAYPQAAPGAIANLPTGVDGKIVAHVQLPFNKLMQRARIDGRSDRITMRTRLGALSDLGAATDSITADIEANGTADDTFDDAAVWFEPDFRTIEVPLQNSKTNTAVIKFASDEVIVGFQFRALDESLRLTDPNLSRPDWLVRRIQVERQKSRQARTLLVPNVGWSMLKQQQALTFGIPAVTGQLHAGVAHYMLDDPTTVDQEVAFFEDGDQLSIVIDTNSPIDLDLDLSSNGTIEVGQDKCFVTILGFRPMGRAYQANRRAALAAAGIRAS